MPSGSRGSVRRRKTGQTPTQDATGVASSTRSSSRGVQASSARLPVSRISGNETSQPSPASDISSVPRAAKLRAKASFWPSGTRPSVSGRLSGVGVTTTAGAGAVSARSTKFTGNVSDTNVNTLSVDAAGHTTSSAQPSGGVSGVLPHETNTAEGRPGRLGVPKDPSGCEAIRHLSRFLPVQSEQRGNSNSTNFGRARSVPPNCFREADTA